jgi:hypothetical protein
MKIAFYCDLKLNNYLTHPLEYKYLHGRHSATGYYYWILKNNKIKNIHLIQDKNDLSNYDIVVFHYDNYKDLENLNKIKIQIVTDRPMVDNCDLYIMANQSFFTPNKNISLIKRYGIENSLNTWISDKSKLHFIHYPPTYGVKQCKAIFPPKTFKFVGRKHTNIKEIQTEKFLSECRTHDINLIFDYDNDANSGDEDVYFCVRNVTDVCKSTGKNNNSGKFGHRTSNRLYQSWYMRTPSIFNISPEMESIRTNELDYLIANTEEEFLLQCLKLKGDRNLFFSMIENGDIKKDLNPYYNFDIIIDQWKDAFSKFNTKLIYD